jgi:hypothetical protein
MTPADDRNFPSALTAVAGVTFDYSDDDGIDYELYTDFLSARETTAWIRAWTGNSKLAGDDFRVFGQDGTGGRVAFWLARPNRPLATPPDRDRLCWRSL